MSNERKFTPHLTDADVARVVAAMYAISDVGAVAGRSDHDRNEAAKLRALADRLATEWQAYLDAGKSVRKP